MTRLDYVFACPQHIMWPEHWVALVDPSVRHLCFIPKQRRVVSIILQRRGPLGLLGFSHEPQTGQVGSGDLGFTCCPPSPHQAQQRAAGKGESD